MQTALWVCPRCKQKFVNRNQSHSCGTHSVATFLKGASPQAVRLFNTFIAHYRAVGDFELHPVKTRVALLTKMRFCAINRLGIDFIDVHFVLTRAHPHKRVHRIENLNDRFFIHHIKIHRVSEIDRGMKRFMKLAYDVGMRKHIGAAKRHTNR